MDSISAIVGGVAGYLGGAFSGILGFLDGFMQTGLLVPAIIALVAAMIVFGRVDSFVLRLVCVAIVAPSVYTILISVDAIRESASGQAIVMMVAVLVAIVLVGRTFKGASRGQTLFDGVVELGLVLAFLFFLNSFNPDLLLGERAQEFLQGVLGFWEDVFGAAQQQTDG